MAVATQTQLAVREVMDIRQAADYLGISGDTLYRYASEGFVPAFKLGNRWRFRKSLLDGWMDEKSGVSAASVVEVDATRKKPVGRALDCEKLLNAPTSAEAKGEPWLLDVDPARQPPALVQALLKLNWPLLLP